MKPCSTCGNEFVQIKKENNVFHYECPNCSTRAVLAVPDEKAALLHEIDYYRKKDHETHVLFCDLYKALSGEAEPVEKVDICLEYIRRVLCGTD